MTCMYSQLAVSTASCILKALKEKKKEEQQAGLFFRHVSDADRANSTVSV